MSSVCNYNSSFGNVDGGQAGDAERQSHPLVPLSLNCWQCRSPTHEISEKDLECFNGAATHLVDYVRKVIKQPSAQVDYKQFGKFQKLLDTCRRIQSEGSKLFEMEHEAQNAHLPETQRIIVKLDILKENIIRFALESLQLDHRVKLHGVDLDSDDENYAVQSLQRRNEQYSNAAAG